MVRIGTFILSNQFNLSLVYTLYIFCYSGINRTALREIKLLQELSHPNIIGVSHVYIHINLWCAVVDYMLILTSVNLFSISAPGCFWTQIQHQSCLWFHGDRSRGDNNALGHLLLFLVTSTTNLSQSKAIKNYSNQTIKVHINTV